MPEQKGNRHVVPTGNPDPDKAWAVVKPGYNRVSSYHRTQADARQRARDIISNSGGGELRTHRPNGQIRDSDTISPGNDPFPPKG